MRANALGVAVALGGRKESVWRETSAEIADATGMAFICPADSRNPEGARTTLDHVMTNTGIALRINDAAGNLGARAEEIARRR